MIQWQAVAHQPRDRAEQMLPRTRRILESTADNFIASDSLTRGAAIAFYGVTSLIPVLVIVIAIAGLAFGEEAARGALVSELAELLGSESATLIQGAIESAHNSESSTVALFVGSIVLALTVSGVFGELQSALNAIWKVDDRAFSISRLLRGRAVSIGLVIGLGFLLLVSLVIDAGVSATSGYINRHFQYGTLFVAALNMAASFVLTWTLFTAIYKVLPDKPLDWRDVIFGAFVTSIAMEGGKNLISLYLSTSTVISSYGAAGALASLVLWIYYSAQIFLLGASFTKACAVAEHRRRGQARRGEAVRQRGKPN
jgi:membrane protein